MAVKKISTLQSVIVLPVVGTLMAAIIWFLIAGGTKPFYKLAEQLPAYVLIEVEQSDFGTPFSVYATANSYRKTRTGLPSPHRDKSAYKSSVKMVLLNFDKYLAKCGSDNFGFTERASPILKLQTDNVDRTITYELSVIEGRVFVKLSPLIKHATYSPGKSYWCDNEGLGDVIASFRHHAQLVYGN